MILWGNIFKNMVIRHQSSILDLRHLRFRPSPNGIELVFHTENSMKYRSYILFLNTVLTYHFGMKYQYFVREKSSFGMLKWYLRIVCKIGISYCFRYEILIQFYLGLHNISLKFHFSPINKLEICIQQNFSCIASSGLMFGFFRECYKPLLLSLLRL
jgi:hypothetical protein